MYGVVEFKGHQYMLTPGDIVDVDKLEQNEGELVSLDNVLFISGETPFIGQPHVEGAKIEAKVIRHDKSDKVTIFRRGVGKWHKKNGHRQQYSSLLVTAVHDGKGNVNKIDPKSKIAVKYLK